MDGFREEKEMKKVYKKPVLYIEKFTVDKNFANSCGAEPGTSEFGSEFTCSWNAFFHDGVLSCELDPKDQETEADCYNGLWNSASPFAS